MTVTELTSHYSTAEFQIQDGGGNPDGPAIATVQVGVLSVGADGSALTNWNQTVLEIVRGIARDNIGGVYALGCDDLGPQPYVLADGDMAHWIVLGIRVHSRSLFGTDQTVICRQLDAGLAEVRTILTDARAGRMQGQPEVSQAETDELMHRLMDEVRKRYEAAAAPGGGPAGQPRLVDPLLIGAFGSGAAALSTPATHQLVWFSIPGATADTAPDGGE